MLLHSLQEYDLPSRCNSLCASLGEAHAVRYAQPARWPFTAVVLLALARLYKAPGYAALPRQWAGTLAHAVLSDAVPLVVSRQLLLAFSQDINRLSPDSNKAVAT